MKKTTLLSAAALLLIAGTAAACAPCKPTACQCPYKDDGISRCAEGEALVTIKVSEKIIKSKDREKLLAELCAKIAKSVSADVVYISPIFDNGTNEPQNTTAHFKSTELTTKQLIELLLKDKNIAGASPNYMRSIN